MHILKISDHRNNHPNFGLKYKKPSLWNKELLSYVASSNLAKEINEKYPKASVKMKSSLPLAQKLQYGSAGVEFDFGNGQKYQIISTKKNLNTFDEYYDLFRQAGEKIYNTKLADIENELTRNKHVKNNKPQNTIISSIKNFIGLSK